MHAPTVWSRLTRVVLVLVAAAAVLLVGVWYLPLIRQNQAMREELLRLGAEARRAETEAQEKRSAIEALKTDPKAVERLAREKLGLAKPGETVVHFEPAGTNLALTNQAGTNTVPAP
ncbi:MAG TPA: septum formation initiator family protein [Verrucomicrobiota bacterium]|nr:septum formation initiator family protein [Verrucomicrobiota bacterium]HNU50361.1 septum formation initiator family protein [Verrucomicrobiota bacterium]